MKCIRCRLALTEKDGEGATICRWCRIPAASLPASTKGPSGVESTATERFVPTRFTETRASVAEDASTRRRDRLTHDSPSAVIARPSAPPPRFAYFWPKCARCGARLGGHWADNSAIEAYRLDRWRGGVVCHGCAA